MLTKDQKQKIAKEFGKSEKNTGDAAVQVAILTSEIELLKTHFEKNKKDIHSKRGFLAKIELRKKVLTYLRKTDFARYEDTIKKLKLRK